MNESRPVPESLGKLFGGAAPAAARIEDTAHVAHRAATYRPDIDGMRAIAIAMVIVFHAFPGVLHGGFTGVDVFFVISGYLITQLVLNGLEARTFSLLGFYQRRARRIVPALLAVLAACCAFGWFTLLPGEFRWFGSSLSWCAPFLANVHFAAVTRYFEPWVDYNMLLHLWSLGVEEQFYLVCPLLLMLAARRRVTIPLLGAVIAASLSISLWGALRHPAADFFLPGARAWELALGGLLSARQLAAAKLSATDSAARWWSGPNARSVAGLALIAMGAVLLIDKPPGPWSAVPCGGAALLIAAGPHSFVGRQLLSRAPVVFIGKISYSLYLWHWPLLSFARLLWGRELSPAVAAGVVALAVALAFVTYRLVELPIRYGSMGGKGVSGLIAGLAVFTVLGMAMATDRISGRLSGSAFNAWEAAINDWQTVGEHRIDARSGLETYTLRGGRNGTALFIGDSHVEHYWPRVAYLIEKQRGEARSAVLVSRQACPPLPDILTEDGNKCEGFFRDATAQAFMPEVDTVVFGAYWELYLLGEFSIERPFTLHRRNDLLRTPLRLDSPAMQDVLEQFAQLLTRLTASGRRVYIVLSNVTSPEFFPVSMVPPRLRLSLDVPGTFAVDPGRQVDRREFDAFVAPLVERLRDIAARSGAQVLDPSSTLCAATRCPAVGADGLPLYVDNNHLRATTARERAGFLDEALLGQ